MRAGKVIVEQDVQMHVMPAVGVQGVAAFRAFQGVSRFRGDAARRVVCGGAAQLAALSEVQAALAAGT